MQNLLKILVDLTLIGEVTTVKLMEMYLARVLLKKKGKDRQPEKMRTRKKKPWYK